MKTSVDFLGQQICKGGMTPIEVKLKAAQDRATPKDIRNVWSFLGSRIITNSSPRTLQQYQNPYIIDIEAYGVEMGPYQ